MQKRIYLVAHSWADNVTYFEAKSPAQIREYTKREKREGRLDKARGDRIIWSLAIRSYS